MAQFTISRIRDCIRSLNYVVLTIFDLENIILTGEIIKRQRDRQTLIKGVGLAIFFVGRL